MHCSFELKRKGFHAGQPRLGRGNMLTHVLLTTLHHELMWQEPCCEASPTSESRDQNVLTAILIVRVEEVCDIFADHHLKCLWAVLMV